MTSRPSSLTPRFRRARLLSCALAVSTTLSLTACAGSTPPLVERPRLPPAPVNFGKPVSPPALARGESVRVFAIKNRAALHQANKRLENDAAFWRDTEEAFSREPEPEPGFFERLF